MENYKIYFEYIDTYYFILTGTRHIDQLIDYVSTYISEEVEKLDGELDIIQLKEIVKKLNADSELQLKLVSRLEFKQTPGREHYFVIDEL